MSASDVVVAYRLMLSTKIWCFGCSEILLSLVVMSNVWKISSSFGKTDICT